MFNDQIVLDAIKARLEPTEYPLTTTELATALILALEVDQEDEPRVFKTLQRLAPVCGMAKRGNPELKKRWGKEVVARPWLWLPKSEWTPPTPLQQTAASSLLDRLAALEALEARVAALEQAKG